MSKNLLVIHMTGEQSIASRAKLEPVLKVLLAVEGAIISRPWLETPENGPIDMGLSRFNMSDIAFGLMDDKNVKLVVAFATNHPDKISIEKSKVNKPINTYNVYINNEDAIKHKAKYKNYFKEETKTKYFKII